MKSLYRGLFTLALALLAFIGTARAQTALQALHQAAQKEGEVIIWTPLNTDEMRMLNEGFSKDFPGIKVVHFELRETDFVPRIIAEARQGVVSLDMGTTKYIAAGPMIERDLVQPHSDWTKLFKDINPGAVAREGKFLANDDLAFIVAVNTSLVKPDEVPNTWEDVLHPRWKGKILFEPRANAFAYLGLKWGREKVVDYVTKLKSQNLAFVKGGTALFQQLVAGAGSLAIGGYVHRVLQLQKDGASIDWARKISPIGAMPQDIFTMRKARHPNAAKLFGGWLASDKAQTIMNTKLFRGALNPGSSYTAVKEFEKNKVEIVKETIDNYKQAADYNQIAAKIVGVYK